MRIDAVPDLSPLYWYTLVYLPKGHEPHLSVCVGALQLHLVGIQLEDGTEVVEQLVSHAVDSLWAETPVIDPMVAQMHRRI